MKTSNANYIERRSEIENYFDRTAAKAWERLTSNAPVGRIRASVRDVQIELTFAVVLVVAVIFAFLGDARATLIPSLSVPLSLVGTLAVPSRTMRAPGNTVPMRSMIAAGPEASSSATRASR